MGRIDHRGRLAKPSRESGAPSPATKGNERPWRRHAWRLLALWGLVLIAYSNSFHAALVFDNGPVIGDDPRIREATPQNLRSILTDKYWFGASARSLTSGLYRPLTTLSYMLNYAALGNGHYPAIPSPAWAA